MHVDYDADIEVAVDVDADLRMYGVMERVYNYTLVYLNVSVSHIAVNVFFTEQKKYLKTTFFKQILSVFNCTSPIKLKVYGILKVN